ncbi:MAG TPA: DUF423 domain-containing protein [Bacteroidota bacterium]|nr:DUF423 domain-containing protein [Bacteroidota bacterium]
MRKFVLLGSLFAFAGVALGAFAAHLLKDRLTPEMFSIFEVGVRYHMYHALGLFGVAWLADRYPQSNIALSGWLFAGGIVIFSGSLYLLSLTGERWMGMITPIGGLCFLAGWLWMGWRVWKSA